MWRRMVGASKAAWAISFVGVFCCLLVSLAVAANELEKRALIQPPDWGIALAYRLINSPFATQESGSEDLLPLLYYQGEYLYLRGDNGGLKFAKFDSWFLSMMASYRLLDLPKQTAGASHGNSIDPGLGAEYQLSDGALLQLQLMSDKQQATYVNANFRQYFAVAEFKLELLYNYRYKSVDFNQYYYGIEHHGFDLSFAAQARYPLYQNLYFLAKASLTQFNGVDNNALFEHSTQAELLLGLGLFNDTNHSAQQVRNRHYFRLSYGLGSLSNVGDIVSLENKEDPFDNRFFSLHYGLPLANALFELPMDLYLTPGFIWHLTSPVQTAFPEYLLAIKGFYQLNWPTVWRLGLGVGLSYSEEISWVEQIQMLSAGNDLSNLMNYIDISLDLSLGELLSYPELQSLWLGYGIHHRSGIFAKSATFGNIKGGSNYHNIYVQWHW